MTNRQCLDDDKLIKRYRDALEKNSLFIPKKIYIEGTNNCNSECRMCPHSKMKRPVGHMAWDLFTKIISDCKFFGNDRLQFFLHHNGEPLLDPLLFERIACIKSNLPKSEVLFHTNASLLDARMSSSILNSGVNMISFSVDGASPETYEEIRMGLKYKTVKDNLDNFFKLKKKNKNKVRARMQMVVCDENKDEIKEFEKIWRGVADEIFFKTMHNFLDMGTSIKTKRLSKLQRRFCSQPFDTMVIYQNGNVGLCCWDYNNMVDLGNIAEASMLDIYNGERFGRIRLAMCKRNCGKIVPCNSCSQIYGNDMEMSYF